MKFAVALLIGAASAGHMTLFDDVAPVALWGYYTAPDIETVQMSPGCI